jgi:hypothetical protein
MGVRPPERIMTQRTTYLAENPRSITDSIQQIGELGIMLREIIPINRGKTAIMTAVVVVVVAVDGLDAKPGDTWCKRLKQERNILINTRHTVGTAVKIYDRNIKFV